MFTHKNRETEYAEGAHGPVLRWPGGDGPAVTATARGWGTLSGNRAAGGVSWAAPEVRLVGQQPRVLSVFDPQAPTWDAAARAFGQRLRALRGNRTQADIAAEARISRVYLSDLEKGKRPRPSVAVLERLAGVLGVELVNPAAPAADIVDTHNPQTTVSSGADPVARPPRSAHRASAVLPAQRSPIHNAVHVPLMQAGGGPLIRVYRSGTRGDPRSVEEAPMPVAMERIPAGREAIVGERAFIVQFRGERLGGWHIRDGDYCWINPDLPFPSGALVAVEILDEEGDYGLGVYEAHRAGPEGAWRLYHRPKRREPPVPVKADHFTILGPVVGVESWRSPDEARSRCAPPTPPEG